MNKRANTIYHNQTIKVTFGPLRAQVGSLWGLRPHSPIFSRIVYVRNPWLFIRAMQNIRRIGMTLAISATLFCAAQAAGKGRAQDNVQALEVPRISSPADFAAFGFRNPRALQRAVDACITNANKALSHIRKIPAPERTFANTAGELDRVLMYVNYLKNRLLVYARLHTQQPLRDAARRAACRLDIFIDTCWADAALCAGICTPLITDQKQTREQERLMRTIDRLFSFGGARLSIPDNRRVQQINQLINTRESEFLKNIAQEAHSLNVKNADLAGLPNSVVNGLEKTGEASYRLPIDRSTGTLVLRLSPNVRLRERIWRALTTCAYPRNIHLFADITQLYQQLGHAWNLADGANYYLQIGRGAMLSPDGAQELLDRLCHHVRPQLNRLVTKIIAQNPQGSQSAAQPLSPGDWDYALEMYKNSMHTDGPLQISDYFPLPGTIERLCAFLGPLLDLRMAHKPLAPLWGAPLSCIEIRASEGTLLGYIILDLYARRGKLPNARHANLVPALHNAGAAVSVVVAHFSVPGKRTPTLLSLANVKSLCHELGHALHAIMGRTTYALLSGTKTAHDLTEAVAQLFGLIPINPAFLATVARHYQTEKPLSESATIDIIRLQKLDLIASDLFGGGLLPVRLVNAYVALWAYEKPWTTGAELENYKYATFQQKLRLAELYKVGGYLEASDTHTISYGPLFYTYIHALLIALKIYQNTLSETGTRADPAYHKKLQRFVDLVMCKGG